MKRTTKLLSLLLAIVFVVSLLPTFALAAGAPFTLNVDPSATYENTPARAAGATYKTLAEAITAAEADDTIKLMAAVTLTELIAVNKTLTIDLNNNSITGKSCRVFTIMGGTLTLDGTGTVSSTHTADDGFVEANSVIRVAGDTAAAKLIVKSGVTISSAWCYGVSVFGAVNTQALDVYGAVSTTGIKSAICGNGSATNKSTTINIFPGATVTAENSSAVYHPQAGTLTITGGTITGTTAVEAESGTVSISDAAKLTATGSRAEIGNTAEDGAIASGYALAVINRAGYKGNVVATISGGEFKGAVGIAKAGDGSGESYAISITNGSFTDLVNAVKYAASGATIKLLANVELDSNYLQIKQNLTIDLNGFDITSSSMYFTIAAHTGKTVTVKDSSARADGVIKNTHDESIGVGVYGGATFTLESGHIEGYHGVYVYESATSAVVNINGGTVSGKSYGIVMFNGSLNVTAGKVETTVDGFAIAGNGTSGKPSTAITISGGTITGITAGIYHPQKGTLNITGGSISGGTGIEIKGGVATISGTDTVIATSSTSHDPSNNGNSTSGYAVAVVENALYATDESDVSASITGGKFKGPVARLVDSDRTGDEILAVSGGYFTVDPSAYLAPKPAAGKSYAVLPSGISGYSFKVDQPEIEAVVAIAPPAVTASLPSGAKDEEVTAARQVASALAPEESDAPTVEVAGLTGPAGTVVATLPVTVVDTNLDDLKTVAGTDVEAENVNVYVQPYLDIQIKDVKVETGEATAITEITLDIKPMAKTVITTATDAKDIDENTNAVVVGEAQKLTVTTPVTIAIPLPDDFAAADTMQIKHVKGNGAVFYYTATITETDSGNVATFTVTNGFSRFTLQAADTRTLTVNYDSSVAAGIYNITDVGGALSTATPEPGYSFSGWKFYSDDAYATALTGFTGTYTTLPDIWSATEVEGNITVFAKAQFSPLPGPSEKTYNVTVSAAENGKVTADKARAAEGATVTLTIAPAEGFELDALTVQDKDGKAVAVENNAFKMPASDVTVTAAFIWKNPYSDVKAADWFYDAVKYVTEKGLFEGDGGKFDPNGPMNRAMMVTVLWRMEGSPEAAACAFEDVPADQWYYAAVCWAAEKKVVEGYDAKTFAPLDPITREQMVTMLYNYAVYKGLAAKPEGAMGMAGFTDAGEIHDWAYDAMQWAVLTGLVEGDNGLLSPRAGATRAQVATLLMRYCETILK